LSHNKVKLEIWGRAQREVARRRKSNAWKSSEAKSRGPNSNTLAYTECALTT